MKGILLGTAPGFPIYGKSHSAVFVESNGKKFLLDCGEGTAQKVLKHGLDGNSLDAVVIAHNHPDHLVGAFMLIQMLYLQGRTKELYLYMPEAIEGFKSSMDMYYLFPEKFKFELIIEPIENVAEKFKEIEPIENDHLKGYKPVIEKNRLNNSMKSYSIKVDEGKKSMIYSSDVQSLSFLHKYLEEIELLIIDALHPSWRELANLIDLYKKKLILTHSISDGLLNHLKTIERDRYVIAEDDLEFTL